jgi:hypothetical protein
MPSDGAMDWMAANWLGGIANDPPRHARRDLFHRGLLSAEQGGLVTRTCQRMSRSSTASTIKLGVHATMIPSKKAWVSSIDPLWADLSVTKVGWNARERAARFSVGCAARAAGAVEARAGDHAGGPCAEFGAGSAVPASCRALSRAAIGCRTKQ